MMSLNLMMLGAALLAPGVTELEQTLEITPAESGHAFESSDPANPIVLSGGRTIVGWQVGADGVWRVTLPEVRSGKWNFSQLFVNGERRRRPCVPADGFYLTTDNAYTNEPGMPFCGFVYNPTNVTLRDDYANANDIEVEIFYNWSVAKMRLAEIDLKERRVRFTSGKKLSGFHSTHKKPRRWHLENVKEAFGRAGEWYLDRPTGVLSYKPFPGETPETCRIVAPCLKQILRVIGEKGRPVKDVVFRNVRFRYANVVVPEDGAYVVQGELDVPAAVELNRAENVRFESCAFESVGGWAVAFGPGCYGNAVDSCLLRDLGAGGVKVGAPYGGYTTIGAKGALPCKTYAVTVPDFDGKAWDLTGDTRIENCRMIHGGRVYHAGMGVLAGRTWGAKILHNEISHFDYTAISVGWDWDNKIVMAHDNEVAYNHCWCLGRRVLSDMGMVYTLGNQPGTTIHDNHLHGIDVFEYGGKGIYLDECTSHVKVYNNLIYDTRCSLSQSYTIDCEVFNNVFFCPKGGANLLWRTKAGKDDVAMNAHHNIIVWNRGGEAFERCNDFTATPEERRAEELRRPNPASGAKLDHNLYWKIDSADPKRLFRPKRLVNQEVPGDTTEHPYLDFPAWQALSGMDANSLCADPGFVDAGALDFRLRPDSPARKLGIKPFDYHRAGLLDPKRVPAAELRELKAGVLNVQRSLHKMASSTADRPTRVRILFYGQSLVEQGWCTNVLATLRRRYPTAVLEWENRAVGGFESPLLVRAAETDLYPFYPDLVFFNDYGDTEIVRAMIERLKARTTAEVVLWTDRIRRGEDPRKTIAEDDARSRALMSIAEDCGCLLVHLRRKWSQMLIDEKADPMKYLSDGVHLNAATGAFARIADFISEELVELDGYAGETGASGRIEDFRMTSGVYGEADIVGSAFRTNGDGSVDFTFVGNRVVGTAAPWRACYNTSPCKILLDGREMSGLRELFCHERASGLFSWMPLVLHVGAEKAPVAEEWTLTYVEGTDPQGRPVKYRVDGSVTGFDGFGSSDADFISNSGRVRILATDFHAWQYDYFVAAKAKQGRDVSRLEAKPGQWICWKTVPTFTDRLSTYFFDGKPNEIVLVSGCSNAKHTLTFKPAIRGRTPVFEKLTVHTPHGFECAVTTNELAGVARRAPVNPEFDPNKGKTKIPVPTFADRAFAITDFGARPDGSRCTAAIAAAIEACAQAGGGRVVVPKGEWTTGAIRMKSGCDLHLEEGATLVFTDDPADYLPAVRTTWEGVECLNYSPLVYIAGCTNVAITGHGTLAPKMDTWRTWFKETPAMCDARERLYHWCSTNAPVEARNLLALKDACVRPHLIQANRTKGLLLDGFRIRESPFWMIHLYHSEDCTVRNLDAEAHGVNNDGVDIEMTRNVLVENCRFDQGDDGIVLKSGRNRDGWRLARPTENVEVRNCSFKFAHSLVAAGTELSGGIRNIWLHDCTIGSSYNLLYVKTNRRRGGFVENILLENIDTDDVRHAMFALKTDVLYQWADFPDYEIRRTRIHDITVRNVHAKTADRAIDATGDPACPPRGIRFENVTLDKARVEFSHIEGIDDIEVNDSGRQRVHL